MSTLPQRFAAYIQQNRLLSAGHRVLVAVSGGVDSVVLCELLHRSGFDFVMAHCNFQLRGAESERDEAFVRSLATAYGRRLDVQRFATAEYARDNHLSTQAAARQLRYDWFHELLRQSRQQPGQPLEYLLTAHHLDDAIETSVMNFFKGTGIAGLRGILPRQGNLVRPLLFAYKEEILDFARRQGLSWVEDSSNAERKYTRNFVRHDLLPRVESVYPGARTALAASLERFRDTEILYRQAIAMHQKSLLEYRGDEVHIPVLKLKKVIPLPAVLHELLAPYGFSGHQVDEVIRLLDAEPGKWIGSATHRLIRHGRWLILAPLAAERTRHVVIDEPGSYTYPGGTLQITRRVPSEVDFRAGDATAWLDARSVRFPLILRPWKAGDYFYPLGMAKKKKLARFFIDKKLSLTDKEKVWVLESAGRICWVVGYRIDERCKVHPSTREVVRVRTSTP
ncbi:MAG TPA: tRNA lysidine(34) synthetase TilS [Chitinophagaceae bacterium]|nr:tRNA lysidine(34) synthetase TilS [Chitinophagaceae bacterium]